MELNLQLIMKYMILVFTAKSSKICGVISINQEDLPKWGWERVGKDHDERRYDKS